MENYRVYISPTVEMTWIVMSAHFIDEGDGWITMRYECVERYERDGIPYERFDYKGRTKVCPNILAALEAASGLYTVITKPMGSENLTGKPMFTVDHQPTEDWITDPLTTPLEVRGYGDGDEWVLFTMCPQFNGSKLQGWITNYHPYRYNTLEHELDELGVELPPTLKTLMSGDHMEDLTQSIRLPSDKDFPELKTPEACEDHAVAMIDKHGDKLPHYSFN